jgi:hypothetical protein
MGEYNWDGVIVLIFILYIYIVPFLLSTVLQIYIYRYNKKLIWLGILVFTSALGVIITTYMEAIHIDNNGLSGGQYDWIKYFIWSTINYILMLRQIYLVRKARDLKK